MIIMTENKRFTYDNKQVAILKNNEFWLEGAIATACNHSEICNELNALVDENEHIKQVIKEAYNNERTQLGQSVLKQLMEAIQWHKYNSDRTTATHANTITHKVWETTGMVVNYMVQLSYHTAMHVKIMKKKWVIK